jgi:DNA-binding LacI/PurR family transcriptional regulator
MPPRVTLRQIADACACDPATVSRALRDRPEIPPATRARIKAAAKRLHYIPDPALSALVEHRLGLRPASYRENLALISPDLDWNETHQLPRRLSIINAMKARAARLGYKLDFVALPFSRNKQEECARVLFRRRVRGLVFLPSEPPAEELAFPWTKFAVIRLYRPPTHPRISSVDTDYYQGVHLLHEKLTQCGYVRPGLLMPRLVARYTGEAWPRYLAMIAMERGLGAPVHPFVFDGSLDGKTARAAMIAWARENAIDSILAFDAPKVAVALATAGIDVPGQIGLIDLDVEPDGEPKRAGLLQSRDAIGNTAIDQLHGLLTTNNLGLPEHPCTIKVAFRWIDGPSILRQSRGTRAK